MRHEPASPVSGHCLGIEARFFGLVRLDVENGFRYRP
jgi:hypothetical protein